MITHLISASRASLASGNTLILMISPPQALYMLLSALVEKSGPSMQTTVFSVCKRTLPADSFSALSTNGIRNLENALEKGSPKVAWATIFVPSKKLDWRTPLVLSMIWSGIIKSPGRISSLSDPTAEKASIALTPRCFNAAILAAKGTTLG
jgi:hypothetical protein